MPKIQQNQSGGRIIWDKDDWNGLAPNYGGSIAHVLGGNLMTNMNAINPFRQLGVPIPGYLPVAATNSSVVTEFLRKGIVNSTSAYIVSNGALIQEYIPATNTLTTPAFHTITPHGHASAVGNDCVAYNAKVGGTSASRYFYSWSDNTDWDIGVFDFSATFDDDFMSTAPATPLAAPYLTGGVGKPHPLIVGDDDLLYIGDRNFLHAYDGQNAADNDGKFFPAVLTIPYGWVITSFEKVESGLMIFTYYSTISNDNYVGQARAWLWNYGELDITRSYNLNDNITGESFTIGTTVGVFTQGRVADPDNTSKKSKLQLFDGTKFNPIVAFIDDIPIRGGVEVVGDSVKWNSEGIVYTYGSLTLGVEAGLNKVDTTSNGTSCGMLATFLSSPQTLSVSSGATTAGGLQAFSSNYNATIGASNSYFLTALAQPEFPLYHKGRIKNVTMQFSNTVTPANSTELTVILADRLNNEQTILSQHTQVTNAQEQIVQRQNTTSGAPLMGFDGLALLCRYTRQSGTASESFGPVKVIVDYENYKSITT